MRHPRPPLCLGRTEDPAAAVCQQTSGLQRGEMRSEIHIHILAWTKISIFIMPTLNRECIDIGYCIYISNIVYSLPHNLYSVDAKSCNAM